MGNSCLATIVRLLHQEYSLLVGMQLFTFNDHTFNTQNYKFFIIQQTTQ